MPTVSVDVVTYKQLFNTITNIYRATDSDYGLDKFFDLFEDLPLPEDICDYCGHIDYDQEKQCPRCGKTNN